LWTHRLRLLLLPARPHTGDAQHRFRRWRGAATRSRRRRLGDLMTRAFILLIVAASCGADVDVRANRPFQNVERSARPQLAMRHMRGGGGSEASAAAATRAKMLLLASNAGFGSYSVLLRALSEVKGAEPLGTVFICFVRYSFLFLFASVTRYLRSANARRRPSTAFPTPVRPGASLAAFELAFYSVGNSLLSVWGTRRVTSAMSEIFARSDTRSYPAPRLRRRPFAPRHARRAAPFLILVSLVGVELPPRVAHSAGLWPSSQARSTTAWESR
jgi:hypothetical protein